MNVPDYALEETIDFKFTTRSFSTGVPTTLGGTPAIEVYEDNSVTQITAAETLTVDFDGITGLNNLRIAATAANGFEAGKSYAAVISAGTVGGVSVVGEVVAQFSIQRSPVNWGKVTAPTTAVDLSATDIQLCDTVTTLTGHTAQTGDTYALANGVAGFAAINADVEAILADTGTDGVVVASGSKTGYALASTGLDLVTAWTTAITGNITGNLSGSVGSVTGAVGSVTGNVGGNVAGSVGSVTGAVGSVTGSVGGNVTGSVGSVLGGINTTAGVITTLDALDTAQDVEHDATQAAISALNNLSAAQVNAEVLDVLNVDTFAESAGVPASTTTIVDKIGVVYDALINEINVTATKKTFKNAAGTAQWEKDLSDDATTYTETKGNAP